MMQDAERNDHVKRAETLYRFRRDRANDKRSTVTVALLGRGDVARLDVITVIINVERKLREDVGGAAADVEHPLSWNNLEEVIHQASDRIPGLCESLKLAIELG